ncbi:hypothetical protein [Polluticoccus soli]|uniref:hypothetical protein n=1 Tax=Polluticoccus soli TaxID=3034150 RepID=UPI0023E11BDF|nr:hypothetical protein [Flavipsychrobacter sp. JY13-12]
MTKLACKVNISSGAIEVSWEVHPLYVTTDMTSGFLIKNISGYIFPADYFGHILQLAETADGFEYREAGLQTGSVDSDSMVVLEAIKEITITANIDQ